MGNNGNSDRLYFWGVSKITADGDCSHEKMLAPWKKIYGKSRQPDAKYQFIGKDPDTRKDQRQWTRG